MKVEMNKTLKDMLQDPEQRELLEEALRKPENHFSGVISIPVDVINGKIAIMGREFQPHPLDRDDGKTETVGYQIHYYLDENHSGSTFWNNRIYLKMKDAEDALENIQKSTGSKMVFIQCLSVYY